MSSTDTLTPSQTSTNAQVLDATTHANIHDKLARALGIKTAQVNAFVELYDEGATVPFIARYRKEKTQNLDDAQLRALERSLNYERDMATRRLKITELLSTQGNLTDELQTRIDNATSKLELEDIYLPYRPRRRSPAAKARAAGLDVAAQALSTQEITPTEALADYQAQSSITDDSGNEIEVDFSDIDKQLAGVQAIIVDEWTQALDLLDNLRSGFAKTASIVSSVASEEKREVGEKFKDYFEHSESLARLPNHRLLAMLRGRQENVLGLKIEGEDAPFIEKIVKHFEIDAKAPAERQEFLVEAATSLWKEKWRPHIEHRLLTEKRLTAEADAIDVFANNLQHLLMAAPAGRKVILGVDPGIRHGVKMAIVDAQGHVMLDSEDKPVVATVYPFAPDNKMDEAKKVIDELLSTYNVDLVAIGNGTASRETDAMIKEILAANAELKAKAVIVNESGASVYSASELASDELANLDVSVRGAVSIARRLQDPLSELVKVDPKAIGVGQYQHDVNQTQLADSLDKVTQDSVNAVGVDVNTASPAILAHIAGLNKNVAQQIVTYRKEHGAFDSREALKNVPRLGVKTFEQAAGFLRVHGGSNPLDATGVHPESYALVDSLLEQTGKALPEVIGNDGVLNSIDTTALAANDDNISVKAIIEELAKPARDPRPEFKTANFREDVNSIKDLSEGMQLEGVVTNVTAFGCFVDVGVHQDGLVHISQMANDFVADPMNRVKPGDIVSVRVISIDEKRGRIGFSMKPESEKPVRPAAKSTAEGTGNENKTNRPRSNRPSDSRPAADKRSSKPRGNRQDKDNANNRRKAPRAEKAAASNKEAPNKIGTLGALLQEAGVTKTKK
ncbi:RNA-binding transcriptional accessory protein [Psychrobacter sp. Sarcosine-02u-2]|uniref:Tex family protein n=1 Tax=Psychrobacter TaxID=497 RepID=UPI000C7A9E11|nr:MULTISPECIES: Tex family protein [Psychrobacter]MCG3860237.1 RNA-binding transcriptional accessory protein [Psychrobacter sp. Ps5]PKG82686.1 RNA-binding transcriptional accessory protein [Psychrobacter sp. Sarcosine-02u-2]